MNITLSPELQKRIAEKVDCGDVGTADALMEEALSFYLDYEDREMDGPEFRDTKAAIDEALEQGELREVWTKSRLRCWKGQNYGWPQMNTDQR